MALQTPVKLKTGSFAIGKGVSAPGNISGFDIEEYKRRVMAGESGSAVRAEAARLAGQEQIYRTQPQVADLIQRLTEKQDVSDSSVSHLQKNSSIVKTPRAAREEILQNTPPELQTQTLQELRPVSAEGLINDRVTSLAPIPHPQYETQGHDDLVSNMMSSTATPDESHQFAPYQDNSIYQTQPSQQDIIDQSISYDENVDLGDIEE